MNEAKRLRSLEDENARLEKLLAETPLDKEIITVDNGPEFISNALDQWAAERKVKLRFRPARQAGRQRVRRGLQRPAPRRVPQRELVHNAR